MRYECTVCGFVYDESIGLPEENLGPDTPWREIPDSWHCPDCGGGKEDFELIEN